MKIDLYERFTHTYRDGWQELDEHKFVGTVKVLRYQRLADDGIDGKSHKTLVFAPAALRDTDLSYAIADTLGGSNCRHEHDCCGCATTYADVRRISRREYSVRLHTYYNV